MLFTSKKPHYEYLRKKWTARHRSLQNKLWDKHKVSLIGGLLLLTVPNPIALPIPQTIHAKDDILVGFDENAVLAKKLQEDLPEEVRPLNSAEEANLLKTLSSNFGFEVTTVIEGIKLNRNFGIIGGEQHLYRYPRDNLYAHAENTVDWAKYGSAGIAPGLGAWGYFSPSKQEFTDIDKMREKYYLAIQTFLAPGFAENVAKYRDFFKYRKMLVINPKTGQAVVAVVGDAGPAEWTGKHLGGSPEVMDILGLAGGPRKGPVLYFFIDDPDDKIPLGPVKVRSES
ncbi:hypothetical protein A3B42_05205 [Candidatus Daviesbacteria bacterium RIFCSPLOWO2_01_FULL_38_10]|nr:MAG: hypothetical protein US80_C0011G0008 [Candidatus Daviesbacteria bacterium GW2011_GWA2_38_17]OGE28005.1 MAG: hypothetical protein A3D02_04545 [Candidatus Daviesbacteria bacterium RIFCSPHIGHO2_02_FULL_39_41]OGE28035.1 MAG: hypothetical protein A2772_00510 [Candidatus Daviesbacteria bacterium RIFCSPHIGHO2_01_FULL_38_8b]OGE38639.1 MAG: hypothetical protein A3B42_05205 [Candidatus Daviesbacteria bacterium RIFCSPLOWO2_01_FULL_38_10]OGE44267.1 MAG: hypothetical protein A3E67_04585 [Candidatus 